MPHTLFDPNKLNIFIKKLYNKFIEFIFPYYCYGCLKFTENTYLCDECLKKANFYIKIICPICKRRKPIEEGLVNTCCSTNLKTLITFFNYEDDKISKLIKDSKFLGYRNIFQWFAEIISLEIRSLIIKELKNYVLVPVPLYKYDFKERGFNQSEVLANFLSKNLNLNIFKGLEKIKRTKPQATLNFEERKINLKDCFQLSQKPPKNIILIDDIMTTGFTLLECGKILKKSGSKNIIAITIAQ
jgi:ComF family protein